MNELEELRRFVAFVNLWIYRDCSANEEERLSVIQFHPTARKAAKAAGWIPGPAHLKAGLNAIAKAEIDAANEKSTSKT